MSRSALYDLGARKFSLSNVGALSCTPLILAAVNMSTSSPRCVERVDEIIKDLNEAFYGAFSESGRVRNELLRDALFVFPNGYEPIFEFVYRPEKYGFTTGFGACCGAGLFNGAVWCASGYPTHASLCQNSEKYVFFDGLHPTSHAYEILARNVFSGTPGFVFPYGVRHLSTLRIRNTERPKWGKRLRGRLSIK
eukprot:TRINITY_DN4665_c0_g1_i1.p1 TRINITY_DN4665_c0_g1~~TRINITY_DN4665_c0_g1_i1.p1  ORF type:complete len:194 (-),score=5.78 TRINITY_DN4665_c0_g1_i1:7-588(-)